MPTENRSVSITTPLGDDEFIFQRFTGTEEMEQLFKLEIELVREQSKGTVDVSSIGY